MKPADLSVPDPRRDTSAAGATRALHGAMTFAQDRQDAVALEPRRNLEQRLAYLWAFSLRLTLVPRMAEQLIGDAYAATLARKVRWIVERPLRVNMMSVILFLWRKNK